MSVVDEQAADDPDLITKVQTQLREWFGQEADAWQLLRHDKIPRAIPAQKTMPDQNIRLGDGIYQCGDHLGVASINTALASGRAVAEAIASDLKTC